MANKLDKILYSDIAPDGRHLDKRQVRTKHAIITALMDLLLEKNLDKISITELSRKAEIDRTTFYLHYKSVEEIYDEVRNAITTAINELVAEYIKTGVMIMRDPYQLISSFNETISEDLDFFRKAVKSGAFSDLICVIKKSVYEALADAYTSEKDPMNEKKDIVLSYLSAAAVENYIHWLGSDSSLSLDEYSRLLGKLLITGVIGIRDDIFRSFS